MFVFSGWVDETWGISVKLVDSHAEASALPFTEPTGYGLGRAGWISARFSRKERPLVSLMKQWIRESYAQIAPKKLIAQLDIQPTAPAKKKKTKAKTSRAKHPRP